MVKLTKKIYLRSFLAVVLFLAAVRWLFPAVAEPRVTAQETVEPQENTPVSSPAANNSPLSTLHSQQHHRIRSVPSYAEAFPDTNSVQLQAARQWGVSPVRNRDDAEARKRELVYIGSNPYYHVDPLYSSIPYLVPRAAVLLQDIGQAFYDSLYIKGVPLHKIIVTSVLRSQDDVVKLRRCNGNATENSCHLYGTTFDICYNRYKTVEDPEGPSRRQVRNDTLKWVLSEVLRDMRQQNRCFIKYEVKQGCFHMTVR
ncbi:MAG: hypothetical protein IJ569_02925 [Prevotella sp.]|nr:hypothetical protein [Prevotella sp.]